jgi:diguanylate cyclase (GGDEF)-like protein
MVERIKWGLEMGQEDAVCSDKHVRKIILNMCENNSLTVHFQPIFSSKDGSVLGVEALTRIVSDNPFNGIDDLFSRAIFTGTICTLDYHCRENALRTVSMSGVETNSYFIFINVCPETLTSADYYQGMTDLFSDKWHVPKDRIVLEITEKSSITNYKLFMDAITYYKKRGYRIAIDDFGAGHGGLKMLSIIEPDFVKIDRHFISNIDQANIKYNLVDAVTTACHRMGTQLIAEGIEREEELKTVLELGIDHLQGYFLARPDAQLPHSGVTNLSVLGRQRSNRLGSINYETIGDICKMTVSIDPDAPFFTAFERFIQDESLRGLAVANHGKVVGMLHRSRFFEKNILGKCGYGMHLNAHKKVSDLMEHSFCAVESNLSLEEVARKIQFRSPQKMYDDICVTYHGNYAGIVAVSDLLDAITERSLFIAKGSNPLTGLPGNDCIRREIEKHLSQNMHFDVLYIDLDYFKPYNDCYGFDKGDAVIQCLGDICTSVVHDVSGDRWGFVGHIGGDDFILLTLPRHSIDIAKGIVNAFRDRLREFHGEDDYSRGCYYSQNRKGEYETFELLSLSIAIVSTEVNKISSYAELASLATEIKKMAKKQKGFSIVRDRRLYSQKNNDNSVKPNINDIVVISC